MNELETYIHHYFAVTQADVQRISAFFKPVQLAKGEHFLKTGRYADRLGFVQSGLIREYITTADGDITKWISTKGYFVVDLSSFVFGQPARWNIEALTDCELYVVSQEDYRKIKDVVSGWAELEKLFIAKCFTVLEDRVIMHLSMTAEQRYRQLFNYNPALFNTVPLQYLASMLGMTPETFSRIRKKNTNK